MNEAVCPACGEGEFERCEFIDIAEQHKPYAPNDQKAQEELTAAAYETASSYQMLRCRSCGLEFCDPLRAPTAAWYELAYRALDLHSFDRWEFHEVVRRLPREATVFEFGCGSGSFLKLCKANGVSASGMDFSEDGVASCVAKGLDVRKLDLNVIDSSADSARFSQLSAFHFLEHLDRPVVLFEHAAAKALPSAHFWLSVPGDRRTTRRFGVREFLDQPPHHMTRWTSDAFKKIGERHGWRLVETLYEPIPLRTALWWITVHSSGYGRWKNAGRFHNGLVEKAYRAFAWPAALFQRYTNDRHLSGYAMLAHFVFDARTR